MNKKALVITFHLKNCKRLGGFHTFIDLLMKNGYDVDWLTTNVNASWILRNTDRENAHNLFTTWKGIDFEKYGSKCHHFSVPFLIPGKIKKILGLTKYELNYSKWNRIKKRLQNNYDVILVEGSGAQYGADLRRDYPNAKILYRPSDILCTVINDANADEIEFKMMQNSDVTLCVDENQINYYKTYISKDIKYDLLRNPLCNDDDVRKLKEFNLGAESSTRNVVYVGVSFLDTDLVEGAASVIKDANFYIIGPFEKKSHDNIVYTGPLHNKFLNKYLESACVGISPIDRTRDHVLYGYTGKIILYMKHLLPIVATNTSNYLDVNGIKVATDLDTFVQYIQSFLNYKISDRMSLKEEYIKTLEEFNVKNTERKLISVL